MAGEADKQRDTAVDVEREDADTARVIARVQAGDTDAFAIVYRRYFGRLFSYMKALAHHRETAEDIAQQVFTDVLAKIDRYEARPGRPFRAWLFAVARNYAISYLEREGKLEPTDPAELDRLREDIPSDEPSGFGIVSWISDPELTMFVERLPLSQRQVLVLRFLLDLTDAQAASILGRTRGEVRALQHRAIIFLRDRLTSIGRGPDGPTKPDKSPMRTCPNQAFVLRERRFILGR